MFGYKSPEAAKTLKQAFVFSALVTMVLFAVILGTFVLDLLMRPIGVVLIIVLTILDAAVVVPAILKVKKFEDAYATHAGERR